VKREIRDTFHELLNTKGIFIVARILIIEDDDKYRTMVRKMLEKAGYNDIEEAVNGSAGMKIFRQHPFDPVITDIIMPDKEGIETITELVSSDPRIKIIAISGGVSACPQNYLEMARYLGAGRTLAKPFKQVDLIEVVQELLNEM
jgi:CheY-like chemotaxis protein